MTPNHDWQELLRAAHNHPLDAAHYTAVRARVLAEIEGTRSPWRRLAWISGAGALAAALLLALAVERRPTLPPLPQVVAAIPAAPAAPVVRERPIQTAAAQPAPRPPREPLTIKLQTSDPNIVIYWIAE